MTAIKVYPKTITPEQAAKFLEKNTGNRLLNDSNVKFLSEQMKKGDWQITADPIKFGRNGRLLDGQHRLAAIIKTGKPIEMFIAENVDDKVFTVIDTGRNRTAGDILSIQGYSNSNTVSSSVRAIIHYQRGYFSDSTKAGRDLKPTNAEVLQFAEKNPEIIEIIEFVSQINRQFRYISLAPLVMLYWILSRKKWTQDDRIN